MQMALNRALVPCMWRRISDYIPEVKPNYFVSTFGDIFNEKKGNYFHLTLDTHGYPKVKLACNDGIGRVYNVHRILMICFCPIQNIKEMQVNHMNGIKTKNVITNLEWCTGKENMQHAVAMGLKKSCEDHPYSSLTNEQVHIICQGLMQQMTYKSICENLLGMEFTQNMSGIISTIRAREHWVMISKDYDFPDMVNANQKLTNEQARVVCENLQNGITASREILTILGFDVDSFSLKERNAMYNIIYGIRSRKFYIEISKDYNF